MQAGGGGGGGGDQLITRPVRGQDSLPDSALHIPHDRMQVGGEGFKRTPCLGKLFQIHAVLY